MSPRAKRRRRLQQRQTVIYGFLILGLVVASGFAWLTYTGAIPSPWTRDFTYPVTVETSSEFACPPEGAYTIEWSEITANVYNSGSRGGLASSVSGALRPLGVTVPEIGNWDELLTTAGQLQAGPNGIVAAYTLQQLFPDMQVMIDDREDDSVDVILGHLFTSVGSSDGLVAGTPIEIPAPCAPTEPATDPAPVDETDGTEPAEEDDSQGA